MRDGVYLAATVYFPSGDGPWPTLLARTPYNRNGLRGQGTELARQGYAVVAQDVRGRFASDGDYVPFFHDREDGYDTVEWAAAQPWSTGKVGVFGGSAVGVTANMAAAAAPPHLVCAYVIVAPSSWRTQSLWMGGLWRKEMIDGWMANQGATEVRKLWERTPIADPYFDRFEIGLAHERIAIPMYNVAGWFDIFLQGGIDNFVGLQSRGAGQARGHQKILIGPFAHGQLTSRLQFPAGANIRRADMLEWFDYWLKGEPNGVMDEPPIRYYLMGDAEDPSAPGNVWLTAASWPPAAEPRSFYFQPGGALAETPPVESASASAYVYDPDHPVPTVGGANLVFRSKGPEDQRKIGERADYLRFVTPSLEEPLAVVGPLSAELFVSTDAPDTDFLVKLIDVYPDGYEALIQDSGVRLRYRQGFEREHPMTPGEVARVAIDLWSTAYVFNRGHRLSAHVTSSSDPRFDPNPNTGAPLRAEDGPPARPARNTLHHDRPRPSRLILPVVDLTRLDPTPR